MTATRENKRSPVCDHFCVTVCVTLKRNRAGPLRGALALVLRDGREATKGKNSLASGDRKWPTYLHQAALALNSRYGVMLSIMRSIYESFSPTGAT